MQAVIVPAKTVVQINGVPVRLAVDTIVETASGNVPSLTGWAYAYLADPPADDEVHRLALVSAAGA
jgi:hypothetical protein